MMKKVIGGLSFAVPFLASAQILGGIAPLLATIMTILRAVVPILFALAIIYFFWGVAKYVLAAGDPKAAGEGKSIMIYGIIALAVMASVYGLIAFLQSTILGQTGPGTITLPTLP